MTASHNASSGLDLDGLVKLHRRSRARSETCMCGEAYPCRTVALVIEVERLQAELAEEHRWARGWQGLAHRKEAEVERLHDGIHDIKADLDRYVDVGTEVTPADHVAQYGSLRLAALLDDRTETT